MFFEKISQWYGSFSRPSEDIDKIKRKTIKGIIVKADLIRRDCVKVRMMDGQANVYTNCCELHFIRGRLVEIISENNRLIQISVLD